VIDNPTASSSIIPDPFSEDAVVAFLEGMEFVDIPSVKQLIFRLAALAAARSSLDKLLPHLLILLSHTGNPDRVIANLERFLGSAIDPIALFNHLADNPRSLEIVVRLFSGSQFLTDILLSRPNYFWQILARDQLARNRTSKQYLEEIRAAYQRVNSLTDQMDALRQFQHLEQLRIGVCDLLDLYDLNTVTEQLSQLADGLIQGCLEISAQHTGIYQEGFAVIGMGKLGGGELNYSSDIDLLFISQDEPTGFTHLGEKLIDALSRITSEGFLYRVDMRLRPWGSVGVLVSSVKGFLSYLNRHARLWEKQALLKARPVAGDRELGESFIIQCKEFLFDSPPELVRHSVSEMKNRTENQLRRKGQDRGEVKLGEGSIRDIEFVVQFLQLTHGSQIPELCNRNTLQSLNLLNQFGILPSEEIRVLIEGYRFLRTIEHHLQMMDYRQTHRIPANETALNDLGRRLGFDGIHAGDPLMVHYHQHSHAIREIYLRYIGDVKMSSAPQQPDPEKSADILQRHIERMDLSYTKTFSQVEMERHATMADRLNQDHLIELDLKQLEGDRWQITIVAFDYPGELSLICGLMFVYGLDIQGGEVFTYEPFPDLPHNSLTQVPDSPGDTRRKIVDVFIVKPQDAASFEQVWPRYAEELSEYLALMNVNRRREARGKLAAKVASSLPENHGGITPLYPIEIQIDNEQSNRYTILNIKSVDTMGFLYELTNALAYSRTYIARVRIESTGNLVRDTLFVTDDKGQKITEPGKERELRAAIVLTKHFTHLLPHSPNPVSALLHFREFIAQLFENPHWPDELASLEQPEVLEGLARLLGVSDFLWDDFLRMQYTNLFPVVRDVDALNTIKTRSQLQAELEAALLPVHAGPQSPREDAPWKKILNSFKDREMFRIDMRHILGHTKEFSEFSEELTDLAEVIVNSAFHLTAEDLRSVYGTPYLENGQISQMTIVALGKCGGRELGFASDIELMFIYDGNGSTNGPEIISNAEFYEKVVQFFIMSIQAKREGIFEVDLQLRPYGKAGSMAVSLEAFRRYFIPDGPAWAYERQALVKLRPIAGDEDLGEEITKLRDEYVYTQIPFDIQSLRAMRERQLRHLVAGGTFHPKFSPGGLVDIEYLIQALQMMHGYKDSRLRSTNTRQAMKCLAEAGILSETDHTKLRRAHTFLRWLIDSLRVVRGNAKDVTIPPDDSEEFSYLARRLRFGANIMELKKNLEIHTQNVLAITAVFLK
jgi:[glutamine synthetase] adenylyltransferase / [glutamine synthetase]-adenylyl-L-tyrosine phosphorylase